MSLSGNTRDDRIRRRGNTAVGLGAAAIASLAAVLSQAAGAPAARADDLTDILDNVQLAIATGQGEFGTAGADFSHFLVADALNNAIAGWDNTVVAPQEDVFVGTIDAIIGHTPTAFGFGLFPPDLDMATAITDAQAIIAEGQSIFVDALTDFSNADFVDGLSLGIDALNDSFVTAPQDLFLGFTDTVLGV